MENLFDKWKTKVPKYSKVFREPLFEGLSKKGGGSEKARIDLGKHFSNNYELYIYAFFLGLYNKEFVPIGDSEGKDDFGHPIQFWGSKGPRLERKDFSVIQEFIFIALVTTSKLDLIAIEKGEISEEQAIAKLLHTMESYANGGLILIKEAYEENPSAFLQPTYFLNLIRKVKSKR